MRATVHIWWTVLGWVFLACKMPLVIGSSRKVTMLALALKAKI